MSASHTPPIPLVKIDLRNIDLNTHFNFNQPHLCAVCVCQCLAISPMFLWKTFNSRGYDEQHTTFVATVTYSSL